MTQLILTKKFYNHDPVSVAKNLLGKTVLRKLDGERIGGKIVEVEAYLAQGDLAAHSSTGPSKRNQSLYKAGGHLYIHTMRQYSLMDIVTSGEGVAGSVLIRAIEPTRGIEIMMKYRNTTDVYQLANGPGKLCQALGITRDLDGIDICTQESEVIVLAGESLQDIKESQRIGISKDAHHLLRFTIPGSVFVSDYKKSSK